MGEPKPKARRANPEMCSERSEGARIAGAETGMLGERSEPRG
jgi:hypothetical protein